MKKFNYIFSLVFVLVIIAGCTKWVDYSPSEDYRITDSDYLKSGDDYKSMVVSTYTPMQWLNQAYVIADIASDNAVSGGESASDVLGLQQIDDFTHTPINDYLTEIWRACYEGVNRANYLTQYKTANPAGEAINFPGKEPLFGEVYFLRAYYYFTLVKFFGDVPLFTDKRLGVTDSRTLGRSKKSEVYAQIEADLTKAIAVLPNVAGEPGRVTKFAAQALLGKAYMYQNKFDAAAAMLENVVNGPYTLVSDYASMFLESGENGPESIFEVQYTNLSPYWNWNGATRAPGNYAVQQCGIRGLTGDSPYAPGWSTLLPTQELASKYATGDQRKNASILDIEAYKNANPQFKISYQVAPYKNTGLYSQKYHPRKGQTSGQVELNYLNNHRIIRLADVLLMAAEANNRGTGGDAKALTYLNKVRERAFGDKNHNINLAGTALTEAIWEERRLELAMEGDRFFDLVRTGQAEKVLKGFVKGKHELFPIPQKEVDISGLPQNPNY